MFLSHFQDGVGASPINGKLSNGSAQDNLKADMAILEKWMPWQKRTHPTKTPAIALTA
jgi:hypothetical protein